MFSKMSTYRYKEICQSIGVRVIEVKNQQMPADILVGI